MAKPNTKQTEVLKTIERLVKYWQSTNDIGSPTHDGDITEELFKLDLSTEEEEVIRFHMSKLWQIIRKIDGQG